MAQNPGSLKRQKEAARRQHQSEKAERKDRRREESDEVRKKAVAAGEDPDLAGIKPGPQPRLEE
jgi:sRNA-binding protein